MEVIPYRCDNLELNKRQNKNTLLGVPLLKKYQNIINTELQIKDARKVLSILIDKIVLHDNKRIEIFYKFTSESKLVRNDPYVSDSVNLDKLKWVVESLSIPPVIVQFVHYFLLRLFNDISIEYIFASSLTRS